MAESSDRSQPPEKDSAEKIRAELRAAGLLKYLETPPPVPGAPPPRRREATILPFVAPVPKPAAVNPKRKNRLAAIVYLLLAVAILVVSMR